MKTAIKLRRLQDVYLTTNQFEKDLGTCLTIIRESSPNKPFYLCSHFDAALRQSIVRVFINK